MAELSFTACCWSTVSMTAAEIDAASRAVLDAHPGAAVVTSCQRTEAYTAGPCDCAAPVRFRGRDAVLHLGEVAAGLHSVVLGEAQILGQVRAGLADAGPGVAPFAAVAIAAARDLRRQTRFNSHAGALLDRGLKVAGHAPHGTLLILGPGQMARLVAARAVRFAFDRVVMAGRTRPEELASGVEFLALEAVSALGPVDVVAGCLGSGAPEVMPSVLPAARLLLDLGTPRNFAPGQAAPVLTIAALLSGEQQRPHAVRRRRELSRQLAAIVDGRLADLARDGRSPLGAMRAEVERIRRQELERARRLHPDLPEAALDAITRALVDQVLHLPSRRLREEKDAEFAARVAGLFLPA